MSKITKILILSLTALLTLTLLAGCHNSGQTATDEVNLEAIYDLDVDKITVWRMVDNTQTFEITDPTDVQKMINAVDFPAWQKTENMIEGPYAYFIQFGDNATITMSNDRPYGDICKGTVNPDGTMSNNDGTEGHGPYYMPENLLTTLNEMIEKYRPDFITEE
ncbi:MAG: hypothetical protein ACOX05_01930 [Bacillota bacterium]